MESVTTAAVHEIFLWIVRRHTGDCGRWSGDWRLRANADTAAAAHRDPATLSLLEIVGSSGSNVFFHSYSFNFQNFVFSYLHFIPTSVVSVDSAVWVIIIYQGH